MLKKILSWLMILTLILTTVLLAACENKEEKVIRKEDSKKEELILAIGSEPDDGFDPTKGWGRYGSPLFQSTLFNRDKDFNIVNDLATDYEVSEDALTWTVNLRQDVKFSDGVPLTSADVVYTYETAIESGSVLDLNNLEKVEAIDQYTVTFNLKKPQSTFIQTLATTGIVPKHAHDENYAQNPIGSGPFKLVQWDKGQQLIVELNQEYYGEVPYFKKLTFLFLGEDGAFAAAKAGQVDMASIPATFAKQEIAGMNLVGINSVDNRGILFPFVPSGGKTEEGHPMGNDVTADLAIRKAINIAIDRQALVEGILEGYGTPAYSACDGLPWWNPETVIGDNQLDEAKKILDDAGWKDDNGDGILEKGSLKAEFKMLYPAGDKIRQSLAISVGDMIKPLGINTIVEGKSWDELEKMMYSNAILFGWGSHDPLEMYNLYSSETAGKGYYNAGFYANSTVDEYMNKALIATTEKEANEYWKKAQWDGVTGFSAKGDAPWAWLINLKHLYLVKENLDIGEPKIQPHGHGWPLTDNILEWHWTE